MNTEDICIMSTPMSKPYSHQQSGKKRRAPYSRFQSRIAQDSKTKLSAQEDDALPAVKRFRKLELGGVASVISANNLQLVSSPSISGPKPAIPKLRLLPSSPIAVASPSPMKERIRCTNAAVNTPVNYRSSSVVSDVASPQFTPRSIQDSQLSQCKTPLREMHKATVVSPSGLRAFELSSFPNRVLSACEPEFRTSPIPMPQSMCSTPPRVAQKTKVSHKASEKIELTPTRSTATTPRNCSTPTTARFSPSTPQAPLRGCRGNRNLLVKGILFGNKRDVEDALVGGEDPNFEISLPTECSSKNACGSSYEKILPLLAAAKLCHASVIQKLLSYGAVANSVNSSGQTALHLTCQKKHDVEKRPQSLKRKENLSPTGGAVPLSWLKLQDFFESLSPESKNVELHNDDVDGIGESSTPRWTGRQLLTKNVPISVSIENVKAKNNSVNYDDVISEADLILNVKILLESGTNPSTKDLHGKTAADYALMNGWFELHRLLLNCNESEMLQFDEAPSVAAYSTPRDAQKSPTEISSHRSKNSPGYGVEKPGFEESQLPESFRLRQATLVSYCTQNPSVCNRQQQSRRIESSLEFIKNRDPHYSHHSPSASTKGRSSAVNKKVEAPGERTQEGRPPPATAKVIKSPKSQRLQKNRL